MYIAVVRPPGERAALADDDGGDHRRSEAARAEHEAEVAAATTESFLITTTGTRVSHGPHRASRLTVAATIATSNQRAPRT